MKVLVAMLLLGISTVASAKYDVTCLQEDCLKNGWSVFDTSTGQRATVKCEEEDCRTLGWVEKPARGIPNAKTTCFDESCWGEGWETYNFRTGATISQNYCLYDEEEVGNCLTQGWETRFSNGGWAQTLCINSDCKKVGWEVHFPGGRYQTARCKSGGCFKAGWTIYP